MKKNSNGRKAASVPASNPDFSLTIDRDRLSRLASTMAHKSRWIHNGVPCVPAGQAAELLHSISSLLFEIKMGLWHFASSFKTNPDAGVLVEIVESQLAGLEHSVFQASRSIGLDCRVGRMEGLAWTGEEDNDGVLDLESKKRWNEIYRGLVRVYQGAFNDLEIVIGDEASGAAQFLDDLARLGRTNLAGQKPARNDGNGRNPES